MTVFDSLFGTMVTRWTGDFSHFEPINEHRRTFSVSFQFGITKKTNGEMDFLTVPDPLNEDVLTFKS